MPFPSAELIAQTEEFFLPSETLLTRYPEVLVNRLMRLREMYNWFLNNPSATDRMFMDIIHGRFELSRPVALEDLRIIKGMLGKLSSASRDFHRFRANEMLLETYEMAKKRKDTKTMERAASSYARYNRVDVEDESAVPYDDIVVQPFTATSDPSILGIKPIANREKVVRDLISKYSRDIPDVLDIDCEVVDIEEDRLFEAPDGVGEEGSPDTPDVPDFNYM